MRLPVFLLAMFGAALTTLACGEGDKATAGDDQNVNAAAPPSGKSCTLAELHDDGIFEESLSMEEYPDVSFSKDDGKWDVWFGSSLYTDGNDGDRVSVEARGEETIATVTSGGRSFRILVKGSTGQAFVTEEGQAESLLADLKSCSSR